MANTINDPINTDAKNAEVIENYNKVEPGINSNEYDYVLGFFTKQINDPKTAAKFTDSIFEVARQSNIPVLEIVKSMEGQTGLELSASLAYYLNGIRSNTTLLGVQNVLPPNFYAGRNVLT